MKEQDSGNEYKISFTIGQMFILPDSGNLKAFFDFTINDAATIKGARITEKAGRFSVTMPQEQGKDNRWYAIVTLDQAGLYDELAGLALGEYSRRKEGKTPAQREGSNWNK